MCFLGTLYCGQPGDWLKKEAIVEMMMHCEEVNEMNRSSRCVYVKCCPILTVVHTNNKLGNDERLILREVH